MHKILGQQQPARQPGKSPIQTKEHNNFARKQLFREFKTQGLKLGLTEPADNLVGSRAKSKKYFKTLFS
jgi:hypothetical protein